MSVEHSSPSFDSSGASVHLDNSTGDMEAMRVRNYVKEMLKSRIFLGRYLERRLIDERIGYRDVVVVSAAEVEIKRDLLDAQQKLRSAFPAVHWIGITDGDVIGNHSGVCLWAEIDNQPLGPFWFQIRSLRFREEEIIVSLKCLRHISDAFLELEPILTGAESKKIKEKPVSDLDSNVAALNETFGEIVQNLKGAFSVSNVKEFVTFLAAFVIAVVTGTTTFVNFLGNFVLALVREMSLFIKNSTPMFLGTLDFFSKIVGGFYLLLAMLFKQNAPPPTNSRSLGYNRRHKHNSYYDAQFD